jgi:cob(I)alamin adenosyltransferase
MYTRKGDKGETSLFGSRRVPKDSPLVEAYGTIDELNSLLGVVISGSKNPQTVRFLLEIQRMLFVAGADASYDFGSRERVPRIVARDVLSIEKMTDDLLASLPPLRNFILPGGSRTGAQLQLARAVCRRAERRLVTASKSEAINPELVPFFNRLSSLLFNLARRANRSAGRREKPWKGNATLG